jgi:post-segregation antitoxin (ccd killing protein)
MNPCKMHVGGAVRATKYDLKAPKQTVSLTLNSDLYAQAKAFGINTSQVAEEALACEVDRRKAEKLKAEIRKDIEALDAYEAKHGSFVDMAREHYQSDLNDEDTQ